jgi:cbb3-type cytochrome oxidase maturation protein
MNVLAYLLPLALLLGGLGLAGFVWSLRARQFEDFEGAGWRAIADDDLPDVTTCQMRHERKPDHER